LNNDTGITDQTFDAASEKRSGGMNINFKRVLARAIRFWYLIALSVSCALMIAYLVNRYTTRIYPISASIIIKENEENAGAKFLYNNQLINPYRNFYNEIYIMRSYPLLQEVMKDLRFNISLFREGDFKTTEYYDRNFPVEFIVLSEEKQPNGQSLYFTIIDNERFSLSSDVESQPGKGKTENSFRFNDTIQVNDFLMVTKLKSDPLKYQNMTYTVRFNDLLNLAKTYSAKLRTDWAQQGSSVVTLEVTGPVPQKEIDFLNRFIERYQFYDVEKKNKVATMALKFLDEQLVMIGDSLNQFENQVEDFKKRNIITNLEGETNRLYTKIQEFEQQKFQYRLTENYFAYITKQLTNKNFEGIFTPASVGITDEVISRLINELIEARIEVSLFRSKAGGSVVQIENNPGLKSAEQRIEHIKTDILKTIENTLNTRQININFINDQLRLVEQQLSRLPGTERELITIQRNYSLRENLYVYLLQKRTEAGLSKASTTSDIVVVNPPMARGAISPKAKENYTVAMGLGLFLPILSFLLIEVLNNRIQSKEDIEKSCNVPIVGGIGHNAVTEPLIVFKKPRSAMAESFRSLRSNLNYFTGNKSHQIFMVTSSIPGEGKSFTTLNLASVFALAGRKTLILGADLRKPKLYEELGVNNDVGLSQYLSDMATIENIIRATNVDNLYLLPGGPMPPNPSELLLKPKMAELLKFLRDQFDYIIIDTPPLTLVTDAFILSGFADHTLFIVRQDFTPKSVLYALDEFYRSERISKISILFNDLRKSGLGYGYEYGYHYGYGSKYGYGYLSKRKNNGDSYYSE
jgi:capsular exopolysaccharide synthesis family protein